MHHQIKAYSGRNKRHNNLVQDYLDNNNNLRLLLDSFNNHNSRLLVLDKIHRKDFSAPNPAVLHQEEPGYSANKISSLSKLIHYSRINLRPHLELLHKRLLRVRELSSVDNNRILYLVSLQPHLINQNQQTVDCLHRH